MKNILKPKTPDEPVIIKVEPLTDDERLTKMSLRELEKELDKLTNEIIARK